MKGQRTAGMCTSVKTARKPTSRKAGKACCCDSGTQCYNLYEAVTDSDMLYDPQQKILTTGADTLFFDDDGRADRR